MKRTPLSLVILCALAVPAGCGEALSGGAQHQLPLIRGHNLPANPPGELVYEELIREDAVGPPSVSSSGSLSYEQRQRVARPYTFLGADESWIYIEDAWSALSTDGTVESGYRVTRRPNSHPAAPSPDTHPPEIHPQLAAEVAASHPDAPVRVAIQVRDFPDWDLPLRPDPMFSSAADYARAEAERSTRIQQRKDELHQRTSDLRLFVQNSGGRVVREAWSVGYVVATLPAGRIAGLLSIPEVRTVESTRIPDETRQGEFYVGDHDLDSRTDVQDFFDEGYEGGQPNEARHGYADMLAAVIEPDYFEDEACSFQEGANNCGNASTDRIVGMYDCDNDADPECDSTSDFSSTQESTGISGTASHGTFVATIIAGDYTQGQADGVSCGDPAWSSGAHSTTWENTSSGMATEALLLLLGGRYQCNDCSASAFETVTAAHADVANNSWGSTSDACNEASSLMYEDELENAYDDGVFMVVAAGNNNGPSSGSCNVNQPADTPKAFAVNGLGTDISACESDYESCDIDTSSSSRGGGTITVDGSDRTAAFIDIAAPADVRRRTSWHSSHPNGIVYESYVSGTSIAAPIVTGAGLVLKDFMLSDGWTFVNSPGRLHAMMLAMADSWHDQGAARATTGIDMFSGTGRLKTRLFDPNAATGNKVTSPWQWRMKTYTYSTTGTDTSCSTIPPQWTRARSSPSAPCGRGKT